MRASSNAVTPLVLPEIVSFPAEIDLTNAAPFGDQLLAAIRPGIAVVIADMSLTRFADSSAVRALLTAHDKAAAGNAELRIVIPSPQVLRALEVLGVTRLLRIYPSLDAALTN
jgi:anti-anti-sigma factor